MSFEKRRLAKAIGSLSLILKNRFILQSPLQKIKINPLKGISIKTEDFSSVLLGSNTDRLKEQINFYNFLRIAIDFMKIQRKTCHSNDSTSR